MTDPQKSPTSIQGFLSRGLSGGSLLMTSIAMKMCAGGCSAKGEGFWIFPMWVCQGVLQIFKGKV